MGGGMLQQVTVLVKSVRHLPQNFFNEERERGLALGKHGHQQGQPTTRAGLEYRRCLRAQAVIVNETRETGNSSWGRGVRSRQATWLRGADKLCWSLAEEQFKQIKAYTPVCKVHVYATDPSAPTMDTSDSVGWFTVDMRDLSGHHQRDRWVKLQGANPAEVLISSSLAMARDSQQESSRESVEHQKRPLSSGSNSSSSRTGGHRMSPPGSSPTARDAAKSSEAIHLPEGVAGAATANAAAVSSKSRSSQPSDLDSRSKEGRMREVTALHAERSINSSNISSSASGTSNSMSSGNPGASVYLSTSAAEAVSDLDALPVGPGADSKDAQTFSLAISVMGAAGLSGLRADEGVGGFWLSYSIFGVVVQTDRFERQTPPPPGDKAVLEPMMDSFRLRATLQGLCHFLGGAPPLQVYLCTEGRIIAHADVDMSLLLPREDWGRRSTRDFGRTGFEGDFQLCLPGEPLSSERQGRGAPRQRPSNTAAAVVSIGAELTRTEADPNDLVERNRAGELPTSAEAGAVATAANPPGEARSNFTTADTADRADPAINGVVGVRTWSFLTRRGGEGRREKSLITAALQRLELRPARGRADGADPGDRLSRFLIGITSTDEDKGETGAGAGAESYRVVDCGECGEIDTEDQELLGAIKWQWEGGFPDAPGSTAVGFAPQGGGRLESDAANLRREGTGAGAALALVRVFAERDGAGGGPCGGDVLVAEGEVPWPSPSSGARQHVNIKLVSPRGSEVGSCRVCLALMGAAAATPDGGSLPPKDADAADAMPVRFDRDNLGASQGATVLPMEQESKPGQVGDEEGEGVRRRTGRGGLDDVGGGGGGGSTVRTTGVQAEEPPLQGARVAAGGMVPHSYRMSINLASVKDLENAAYVVACYHYPFFGTSSPVRTSLVWAAPRMDTPLSNSCCTFSFGMSFNRLSATVRDRHLVVSIRNKDRFKEEEAGLVTVPLQDVVDSNPQYFRCRDTGKTFTSMAGFRAHLKSRQRSGYMSAEEASRATPVEVKVLDRYLAVAGVNSYQAATTSQGQPARLCSLRVILLLEDMGPTGDPDDKSADAEVQRHTAGLAEGSESREAHPQNAASLAESGSLMPPPAAAGSPTAPGAEGQPVRGLGLAAAAAAATAASASAAAADLEHRRTEWERWRVVEEANFAKRLREKDQALEEKWEARETARRQELTQAQADYSKLESKLRKALSEVETRERQLKAREEAWKSDHAQKLSELQLLQRRLREETKHQVDMERMKVKGLEKQVASHVKSLEDARARIAATDEDLERFRQQHRRTPEGGLRQEVFRLGAAKAEAEAQVERERSLKNKALLEKEEYRAHIHKLARALKRHQERESTCARREMEQLRLEYLAREERFMLDGDRNELRTIKQELDELRHVSLVQEAQAGIANLGNNATMDNSASTTPGVTPSPAVHTFNVLSGGGIGGPSATAQAFSDTGPAPSPPPLPTPAPTQVSVQFRREAGLSSRGGVSESKSGLGSNVANSDLSATNEGEYEIEIELEVGRLVEWRDELLATGMYTPHNPIVRELNRRISLAGERREAQPVPQRQE